MILLRSLLYFVCMAVTIVVYGLLIAWFGWHGLEGPRGMDNYAALEAELAQRDDAFAQVKEKRDALEARVKLMRPESVDPDMASELVRDLLGYEKRNSIVVKYN